MNSSSGNQVKRKYTLFERIAATTIRFTGSTTAFILSVLLILAWLITGPLFNYSDTWQLVINTCTTIITFLMVFLIQHSQNKDSKAVHIKLNELIASLKGPNNRVVDIEEFTEKEIETIHKYYRHIAEKTINDKDASRPHSMDKENKLMQDDEAEKNKNEHNA